MQISDSDALAFSQSQLAYIMPTIREKKYGHIYYPELAPVSYEVSEWATSIETYYTDGTTAGADIGSAGDDIPFVEMTMSRDRLPVTYAGIGFDYTLDEVKKAAQTNVALSSVKASLAQRGFEEHAQRRMFTGDTGFGIEGLLNHSAIPTAAAAETFAAALASSDPGHRAAAIVNEGLSSVYIDTLQIELANTVLLPTDVLTTLGTTPLGTTSDTTVLKFIKDNNAYTMTTGQPLDIRALPTLTGGLRKMVCYAKSEDTLKYHIPMALQFLAPQLRNLKVVVPGHYKLAGLEVYRPGAFNYRTGI